MCVRKGCWIAVGTDVSIASEIVGIVGDVVKRVRRVKSARRVGVWRRVQRRRRRRVWGDVWIRKPIRCIAAVVGRLVRRVWGAAKGCVVRQRLRCVVGRALICKIA